MPVNETFVSGKKCGGLPAKDVCALHTIKVRFLCRDKVPLGEA